MTDFNNQASIDTKRSMSDVLKSHKETLLKQKEQMKKQEEDSLKIFMAAMKAGANPLNPDDGMKPEKMMEYSIALQNASASMRKQELDLTAFELTMLGDASKSIDLLGKSLRVEGDGILFEDKPVQFAYEIPEEGFKDCEIMILNDKKDPIRIIQGVSKPGMQRLEWDGFGVDGKKVNKGEYSILAIGHNNTNEKKAIKTFIYAPVQEVEPHEGDTIMYVKVPGVGIQKNYFVNDGSMSFITDKPNNSKTISHAYETKKSDLAATLTSVSKNQKLIADSMLNVSV